MKTLKFLLQAVASVMVVFGVTSCANDDDDGPSCQICTYTYNGQTYSEEICPEDFDSIEEFESYILTVEVTNFADCD